MGYTKPLVKAGVTALQTGAEKVLRNLPVEQADFIAKTLNFKTGSPEDIFIRGGGLHTTDGPGIINSIQRGEAQDLGQHITNAVQGEPAALNEIARFSDNGTNQVTEDTIKANQLQQANAKYESQVEPKAYNLSEGVEDFMGDTDLTTARAWENPDGGLDQEIKKMLTVGRKTTITTPEGKKVTLNKGDMMTPDMLTGSKKDYYNSLIATGFKTAPDDELVYGFGGQELSKMAGLEGKDPGFSPQLHKGKSFHHKSLKEIQSAIHKRARALRESGDATTDDLINLHALSNSMGAPSGSRKSAGIWLEEFGHNITHKQTAQRKGIEPTTTRWTNEFRGEGKPKQVPTKLWNPAKKAADDLGVKLTPFDIDYIKRQGDPLESAIAKWKVFRKTKMYDALKPDGQSEMSRLVKSTENMSIAELTQFQKEMLEDITKPMTEEMVLMEEVMDSFTPQELLELMKQKDWQTPLNLRRALKDKKAAMKGAKADKALRKQMNAIPDEYWTSKSK
ncbi:hypothetical protein CYIG_00053 [Cyanophage NATL1A-7]|uniref:Predicted protein n=1 Tax=Cyanophage NATL1A-7 TaxID=445693 RepID=E3SNC2_9CAUD|nr:hypothetical protein CYIG_00053 [Cyanophage NATL1A-7]ADP00126.1 predicted protein [Cyanophage NATL1A-7]